MKRKLSDSANSTPNSRLQDESPKMRHSAVTFAPLRQVVKFPWDTSNAATVNNKKESFQLLGRGVSQ